MLPKKLDLRQTPVPSYRAERNVAALLQRVQEIRALADKEKEALGFLPEGAYPDAIENRRLVAMLAQVDGHSEVAGFILFSGVFPNARIQQIVVAPNHRRARVASALINEVISQLEAQSYLTITAAVASDLRVAQAFYERNGFIARHSRRGGATRGRTIVLRARDLDTASFFSLLEPASTAAASIIDLGLRQRSASHAPLYVIDLNVLFDLVRDRTRSALANRLFGAALAHQIRLAVAPEFLVELERTTTGEDSDPILKLARQLPRLATGEPNETDRLAGIVHELIFSARGPTGAGNLQSQSDARHIAQAALARASGYVTSDGKLLAGREQLLRKVGIDVASLDEFVALLPVEATMQNIPHLKGANFEIKAVSRDVVRRYLSDRGVPSAIITEFASADAARGRTKARGIYEGSEVVAVGVYVLPENIDAAARVMIHVRPDHVSCETYADHLIDVECREACERGPKTIELSNVPGQTAVRRAATLRGFLPVANGETRIKVALGRPVTSTNWTALARQTRRRTGLRLPEMPPDASAVKSGLTVQGPDGKQGTIRLTALEDALGPTILVWPGRDGVIIPIAKSYADDLLGTGAQMPLFGSPEAAFVARRTYFNTPRAAALMRPGSPILFYESKRSGGQGAILAAARILDVTIVPKTQVSDELLRRAVVEDVEPLSTSPDVLATTFDNVLRFPTPISFDKLRELGAVGPANLQTTTALQNANLSTILDLGWACA